MKIEEGKYYRSAEGVKVGPMFIGCHEDGEAVFDGKGHFIVTTYGDKTNYSQRYRQNGSVYMARPGEESHRLVSEWQDDTTTPDDYATLRAILDDAYAQAASGKGKERHANDRPFLQQPICEIGRMLGSVCDGELYQAIKKAQEASNMLARGENKRAEAELLGAINYLAAAVILIRESEHGK